MARLTVEARRQQLLQLGLSLFGARPYDAVAIDDIAAEAGISKGLLYHYFGSKKGFYVAVVRLAAELLVARLDAVDPSDPNGAIRDGLGRYLDFVEQRERAYRSLVVGGAGADKDIQRVLDEVRDRIARMILIEMGLPEPRPTFRNLVRTWIGGVEASCMDWLLHRDLPREELVELHTRSLRSLVEVGRQLDPQALLREDLDEHLGAAS